MGGTRRLAGTLGLAAVTVLLLALLSFTRLNPAFDPFGDFISRLGAIGEPYAIWWNLIGFVSVGLLLAGFGWVYGRILDDSVVGVLLALFGVGFAATAIPVDLENDAAGVSKAHVVAICLGLAGFMFALARMAHGASRSRPIRTLANVAATFLGLAMVGQVAQLWSMPVTHRLVFLVVFGWVAVTSVGLLREAGAQEGVQA